MSSTNAIFLAYKLAEELRRAADLAFCNKNLTLTIEDIETIIHDTIRNATPCEVRPRESQAGDGTDKSTVPEK